MKSIIYTQRVEIIESYQERRDCADQRIADYIYTCGFIPHPIPNKAELAEEIVQIIQPAGIILTGGNSLVKYGGNAPERDAMDTALIDLAVQNYIPLYGFCRGMQSILSYFGNELVEITGHVAVHHRVMGDIGSHVVNSYHNQGCIELNPECGLKALAQTEDGVIEAVRHAEYPIFGTMWHPEREHPYAAMDIERIVKLFAETY